MHACQRFSADRDRPELLSGQRSVRQANALGESLGLHGSFGSGITVVFVVALRFIQ